MLQVIGLQSPPAISLVRIALGVVFLVAAAGKLPNQRRFFLVVMAYRVLPRRLSRLYAHVLPWAEAVVGVVLLFDVATRIGAILAVVLLVSFMAAIGRNIARGRTGLPCGCFGGGSHQQVSSSLLVRNSLLVLLALLVAIYDSDGFAPHAAYLLSFPALALSSIILFPFVRQRFTPPRTF